MLAKKFEQLRNHYNCIKKSLIQKLIDVAGHDEFKSFPADPFKITKISQREKYIALVDSCKDREYDQINSWEKQKQYLISRKWLDDLALLTQVSIKKSEPNYQHGRVIYSELREYIKEYKIKSPKKQIKILEIGTARGFSSICMAKAAIDGGIGHSIITVDPIGHNRKFLWNCILDCEGKRSRRELLSEYQDETSNIVFVQGWSPNCLNRIILSRINFAFVDGDHKFPNILKEFRYISSYQEAGDKIIFDDIQNSSYSDVNKLLLLIENEKIYSVERLWSSSRRGYGIATKI